MTRTNWGKSLYTASTAAASSPDAGSSATTPSPGSIWKIKQLGDWKDLLAKEPVMAVFAGHLHDSHRETYQQPYGWSTLPDHTAAFQKLYLAPPLSVKKQDTSPIQARGFSLVHLDGGHVAPAIYWYDSRTGRFEPGPHPRRSKPDGRWHWRPALHWLWSLDGVDTSIERLAVLLIALLAAYLTIVAVWQISAGYIADHQNVRRRPSRQPAPGELQQRGCRRVLFAIHKQVRHHSDRRPGRTGCGRGGQDTR